jgi:hypothetical protein
MMSILDKKPHLLLMRPILLTVSAMLAVATLASSAPLKRGDIYGGGTVAFLLPPGDAKKQMVGVQHGMIAAMSDLPEPMIWSEAKTTCDSLTTSGFKDWTLPDISNLKRLYYGRLSIGGFLNSEYWSATEKDQATAWTQQFGDGKQEGLGKEKRFRVRPVRFF